MMCGTIQGLYLPGMTIAPAQGAGIAPLVAPILQAPQSASPNQLRSGFASLGRELFSSFGQEFGQDMADSMAAWMS
jgi:hypothetical protein